MEILLLIGLAIWIVSAIIQHFRKDPSGSLPPPSSHRTPGPTPPRTKSDPTIYRPSNSVQTQTQPRISFRDTPTFTNAPLDLDIADLVDGLTGVPLRSAVGLYQCRRCKVFYHPDSFDVITAENGGRCVSCLQPELAKISDHRDQRGQNATVGVVTLETYRQHTGHVVTFEGRVAKVLVSRRGKDYAVMFEEKTWTQGFKMVVFRGKVQRIGGPNFLKSLVGRTVRVRGLLILHGRFGYEIVVSDAAMILGVQ